MSGFGVAVPKKFSTPPKGFSDKKLVSLLDALAAKEGQGKYILCFILSYNADRVFYKEECAEQARQITPKYINKTHTTWNRIVGATQYGAQLKNSMHKFVRIVPQRGMGKTKVDCLQWIGPPLLCMDDLKSIIEDTNEYRRKLEAGELSELI